MGKAGSAFCLEPWPYLAARAVWTTVQASLVNAGSYILWCTRADPSDVATSSACERLATAPTPQSPFAEYSAVN